VTLHANSIAESYYKNKFESFETPTRTGTVNVCTAVSAAGQTMTVPRSLQILAKYQHWRCVSESYSCWKTVQCSFSAICSAVTQLPKVQDQHAVRW